MRKYSYTLMLSVSVVVAVLFFGERREGSIWRDFFDINSQAAYASMEEPQAEKPVIFIDNEKYRDQDQKAEAVQESETISEAEPEMEAETKMEAEPKMEPEQKMEPETESKTVSNNITDKHAVLPAETAPASEAPEAPADWKFEYSLFIGDSRTVGLAEYADMGGADIYASSGMSVYKIFEGQLPLKGNGRGNDKQTLEEVLTGKEYKNIFLMLGVNELGYEFGRSTRKYQEVVERIQLLQPHAVIYLQANLHVTKKKSASDAIYNNTNIDKFNQFVKDLTDGSSRIYLDINQQFDDGTGNLAAEYTADDSHVLGRYYASWAEWIRQQVAAGPRQ